MKKSGTGKRYVLLAAMMAFLGCAAPLHTVAEELLIQTETGTVIQEGSDTSEDIATETEMPESTAPSTETETPESTVPSTETEAPESTVPSTGTSENTSSSTTGGDVSISDFLAGQNSQTGLGTVTNTNYKLKTPVILKAYAKTKTSAKITWKSVTHAQGYIIYRKTGSGSWKKIKVLQGAEKLTYTDKTLSSGKTYRYKIRAYRLNGKKKVYSKASNVMKVRTVKPTVSGNYKTGTVYGPSSSKKELNQVRRVAQAFKDNYIKSGMSDAQKALVIFNYVRNTCDYTWENWTQKRAGSAWGALVEGKAHCGGYSRAVKVLCDAAGLKCRYVHANSQSHNPTHRWNLVRIDGVWYVLDSKDGVFLAGTDTFCKKLGMTWNVSEFPTCSKTDHEMFFQTTAEG